MVASIVLRNVKPQNKIYHSAYVKLKWLMRCLVVLAGVLFVMTESVPVFIGTMEDILRTVFGRMTDEKDTSSLPAEMRIKITGKNTFLVPGDMQLEDLNENLHLNLESDNMNTIGGGGSGNVRGNGR